MEICRMKLIILHSLQWLLRRSVSTPPILPFSSSNIFSARREGIRLGIGVPRQEAIMAQRLLRRLKAVLLTWRRRSRRGSLPFLKNFTFKEINKATNQFSMILRNGSHGIIYKARFPDGLVSAVKRVRSLQQGEDTFYENLELFARLHHRHLVRLKGFSEGKDRFLIFDHMENGSLKDCLHDPLRTPLNWRTRLQIAVDIAAALNYLLYFCDPPVQNLSINSSNVLLDENYVAKLSEMAFLNCNLNHMSDSNVTSSEDRRNRDLVFQFGILLLELITGQSLGEEAEAVKWIQESCYVYSMHKMVDADLGDSYDSNELKTLLLIARLCTKTRDNPVISIPRILRYLQGKMEPSAF